jgi:excinuclease ABC subunit C
LPPTPEFSASENSGLNRAAVDQYFTETFGFAPALRTPDSKRHEAALAMTRMNAEEDLRKRLKERGAGPVLDELQQALGLRRRPERIEGFDIAQLDGKHPVASLISFKNGLPDKKNYRYFKLKTVVGIVDDFAAMREAVHRRYSRLLREGLELPDLILIDGGIGQVNAAKGVLDELGADCDIAGLAKRDEEIWLPQRAEEGLVSGADRQQPIRLSKRSEALKILQAVRDETHRFATGLNQRLRAKDIHFSVLESIDGIGKQRAAAIIKEFQTLDAIAKTEPAEIAARLSINQKTAKTIRAAVRLSLEDQAAEQQRLNSK